MKRSDFIKTAGIGSLSLPYLTAGRKPVEKTALIKPKRLKEGDTIALTAPAGIVFSESDFERMEKELDSLGLNIRFGEFVRKRHGYFSGTDYQRSLDLNRFFADDSVDGIMAVRGGWGCARILPYLDFELIKANPKVYCGFSDNTTLHLAFRSACNLLTFHGPNGASEWTELTKGSFKSVVMKGEKAVFKSEKNSVMITPGVVRGKLLGGNLTILTTSLGTWYQPDLSGAILFVEDIGEPSYKIDRMLTHLARARQLEKINGFVFGGCTNCPEQGANTFTIKEVIQQHIVPLGVPAVMGLDISHDPDNFTIPVGAEAVLSAEKGTLEMAEQAVTE